MASGRVMLDVQGLLLTPMEREMISHPEAGGLILFSRNYECKAQLRDLIADIREQNSDILLAVDHEGGRVQRFRNEFVRIPPMKSLARLWGSDPDQAEALSEDIGWLMAAELVALDIDISFAPVLDINWSRSEIIGDRAFGQVTDQIIALASRFMQGMHAAGMAATGKHFPGHGWVTADSHLDIPCDERTFEALCAADIKPFKALIEGGLEAIMPAHIIYQQVNAQTAGFCDFWLRDVLRKQLGFAGVIFSDDLSMAGASAVGGFVERTQAALRAGCDMALVCNHPEGAMQVLSYLETVPVAQTVSIQNMKHKNIPANDARFERVTESIKCLEA
ncbi:beta-N-acetylhexosaminidase [Neptunomonas antarctica]|uniref:Beta-hexosaminidase n=1 Tax=Neptunomonas antarctica TaxID=619304 RepID=A0A1N7LRU5_9GAMM|nr:beta-N-acetylhexosaminidase [Neptunomonas antarctica]SIS76556.1 beta-N-acetylhexosaminidase [Neptunomonas antarctica]